MEYQRSFDLHTEKNAEFKTYFIKDNLAKKVFFRFYSNTLIKIKALSKKIRFYSEFARNKRIRTKHGR